MAFKRARTTGRPTPASGETQGAIHRWYEWLLASSPDEVRAVFHENARIIGHIPDGLHQMTVEDLADFVAAQQSSSEAFGGEKKPKTLSCGIAGGTAGVRSRESYLGMVFIDTFGMLEFEGQGTICNTLLRVQN